MLDVAVAIAAVIALVALVVIASRKFSTLAAINTAIIPETRHGQLKSRLIEERLERKLRSLYAQVVDRLRPTGSQARAFLRNQYRRLLALEKEYRTRVAKTPPVTEEERQKAANQLEALLSVARDGLR